MKSSLCHFPLRHRAAVSVMMAVLITFPYSCRKTDPDVTEIVRAAANGDLTKTQLLLNRNPNLVSSKDREGFTPSITRHFMAT